PPCVIDLGRVVRVDTDRDVDPVDPVRQLTRAFARGDIPARNEDPLDADRASRGQHVLGVVGEPIGVDVTVGIDEAHRVVGTAARRYGVAVSAASTSSRGKSGSGSSTRPASFARAPHSSSPRTEASPFPSGPYP